MKEGNTNTFNQLISDGIVVVDFFASWCGPCKMLTPVLEEVANDRSEISFVKVDIDQNTELAKNFGIMSVPTLVIFKNGAPIAKKSGFMPKELLTNWIEENK